MRHVLLPIRTDHVSAGNGELKPGWRRHTAHILVPERDACLDIRDAVLDRRQEEFPDVLHKDRHVPYKTL